MVAGAFSVPIPVEAAPLDDQPAGHIDGVVTHPNGNLYFFKGDQYQRWVPGTGMDKTGTIGVDGWTDVFTDIDGVVTHPNGNLYFFKGDQYQRWAPGTGVNKTGTIGVDGWSDVFTDIDGVVTHPNGNLYFFKGDQYQRWVPGTGMNKTGSIDAWTDVFPGVSGWCDLSTEFETCDSSTPAQPATAPGLVGGGECSAVKMNNGSTSIVWDDPPADSALFATTRNREEVGVLELLDGEAVRVDGTNDWGTSNPEYLVRAYNATESEVSRWVACTPVTFSPAVAAELTTAGLPVLPSGEFGSNTPGGIPTLVSYQGNAEKNVAYADAPGLCAAGGLRMDVPAVGGTFAERDKVVGVLSVPAGVTVSADFVHHKANTSSGNWSGSFDIFRLNPDGSVGPLVADGGSQTGYYWDKAGDREGFNDRELFTNKFGTSDFLFILSHNINVSVTGADLNPHYRFEDFKFVTEGVTSEACPPTLTSECASQGANFVVTKSFVYQGESYSPGCYVRTSCVADIGPVLTQVLEWACNNDPFLDKLLLAGLVIAVAAGGFMVVGPAALAGTGIGLTSSLWVCDTSDNGGFVPATSYGSLDPACAATNTAITTGAAAFSALFAGSSTAAGLTFT